MNNDIIGVKVLDYIKYNKEHNINPKKKRKNTKEIIKYSDIVTLSNKGRISYIPKWKGDKIRHN